MPRKAAPKAEPIVEGEPIVAQALPIIAQLRAAVPDATCAFDYLDELDRRLILAGWPATTDWWKGTLRDFYYSGCVQFVGRVGRRGGKSTTICRILVLEALVGGHQVAPGDTATIPIISVSKPEAKERLTTIEGILKVLGVEHKALAERIDFTEAAIAFRIFAATVGGVSGFSSIAVLCDEVSKWEDRDTGANPATEVLSSVRPTMAGLPRAKIFLISSPMTPSDAHAKAFDEGNTDFQRVAFAETWVARPALTMEETKKLEPDLRRWQREYAAIPMEGGEDGLLDPDVLTKCTSELDVVHGGVLGVEYVAAMAPMLARGVWSLVICARSRDGVGSRQVVDLMQWREPFEHEEVLREIRDRLKRFSLDYVLSPEDGMACRESAAQLGLHVKIMKLELVEWANDLIARVGNRECSIPAHPELRKDLLALRRADTPTPGGFSVRIGGSDRFPFFAIPAMMALYECGKLPPPRVKKKKTFSAELLSELVGRNKSLYDGIDE